MSNRAGGGVDSSSSSANPDESVKRPRGRDPPNVTPSLQAEGGQGDDISLDIQASPERNSIPPPFTKTVDEIDICPPCDKQVTVGILCEGCNTWFHQSCSHLSNVEFKQLSTSRQA